MTRAKSKRWTEEEIQKLKNLISEGWDYDSIAELMGRKPKHIANKVHNLGLTMKSLRGKKTVVDKSPRVKVKTHERTKVKYLNQLCENQTFADVGRKLGCTGGCIGNYIKEQVCPPYIELAAKHLVEGNQKPRVVTKEVTVVNAMLLKGSLKNLETIEKIAEALNVDVAMV